MNLGPQCGGLEDFGCGTEGQNPVGQLAASPHLHGEIHPSVGSFLELLAGVPGPLADLGRAFRAEANADPRGGFDDDPEIRRRPGIEVEALADLEGSSRGLDPQNSIHREGSNFCSVVVEADDVEASALVPDVVGVEFAGRFLSRLAVAVANPEDLATEDSLIQGLDGGARLRIALVGLGQNPKRTRDGVEEADQFAREGGADFSQGRLDRIVEDRALERPKQVFAKGESEDFVGREGDITEFEAVEEAVVDLAVALFADHREAGVHQRVEVAVNRSAHAAQIIGQFGQANPPATSAQALDEQPLPGQLISPHGGELSPRSARGGRPRRQRSEAVRLPVPRRPRIRVRPVAW